MKQKKAAVGHMTDVKRRVEAKMMAHFKAHGVAGRAQHLAATPSGMWMPMGITTTALLSRRVKKGNKPDDIWSCLRPLYRRLFVGLSNKAANTFL